MECKTDFKLNLIDMLMSDDDYLICTASSDYYFEELSDNWTNVLGYTKKELRSKSYNDFIHKEDKEKTSKAQEQMNSGSVSSFINRYVCKDGKIAILEWSATQYNKDEKAYAVAKFLRYE